MSAQPTRDLLLDRWRRDPLFKLGVLLVAAVLVAAAAAPWLAPHDPLLGDLANDSLAPPGGKFLFGADAQGRDVLSRVLYGARISLMVGLISQAVAVALGLTLVLFFALLLALLEFAGDFNDHFRWVTVAHDQCVDHLAQFVQTDVHGGVGDAPEAPLRQILLGGAWIGKPDMALQCFSVVGQRVHHLAGLLGMRQRAMAVKPGPFDGFRVGHDIALKFG